MSGLAHPAAGPVLLLGRVVMRAIGRISYSWYLWHYPVLILAPFAVGHVLAEWQDVGLAWLSGLLAIVSFRLRGEPVPAFAVAGRDVEAEPGNRPGPHGRRCVGLPHLRRRLFRRSPGMVRRRSPPSATLRTSRPRPEVAPRPRLSIRPSPPWIRPSPRWRRPSLGPRRSRWCRPISTRPSPTRRPARRRRWWTDACCRSPTVAQPPCLFGDTTSTRSIILFGDSHAAMWFPSVDAYANAHGYRLYVWTKATCPPVDISFFSPVLGRTFTECTEWRNNALASHGVAPPGAGRVRHRTELRLGLRRSSRTARPGWLGLAQIISTIRATGSPVHGDGLGAFAAAGHPRLPVGHISITCRRATSCAPAIASQAAGWMASTWPARRPRQPRCRRRAVGTSIGPWFCTSTCVPGGGGQSAGVSGQQPHHRDLRHLPGSPRRRRDDRSPRPPGDVDLVGCRRTDAGNPLRDHRLRSGPSTSEFRRRVSGLPTSQAAGRGRAADLAYANRPKLALISALLTVQCPPEPWRDVREGPPGGSAEPFLTRSGPRPPAACPRAPAPRPPAACRLPPAAWRPPAGRLPPAACRRPPAGRRAACRPPCRLPLPAAAGRRARLPPAARPPAAVRIEPGV